MLNSFMKEAISEAYYGIETGAGGPFGAVIVKNGKIIGKGHNRVIADNDPTAHGEIQAIRDACRKLQSPDLRGCQLYTTAQPCPMCVGAILWAGIEEVYYGCPKEDTEEIGFRDRLFYDILCKGEGVYKMEELDKEDCLKLFEVYSKITNKQMY